MRNYSGDHKTKVLIVPDKFKGSLSAGEVAEAVKTGVLESIPNVSIKTIPLADGGDGSLQILLNDGYEEVLVTCNDAFGVQKICRIGYKSGHAFIELAEICGISRIDSILLNPWLTSTFGLGQAFLAAINLGANKVTIALGGSASIDGGFGFLGALGLKGFDARDRQVPFTLGGLEDLKRLDFSNIYVKSSDITLEILCDVDNPLLGQSGAVRVYGEQKGLLERDLNRAESCIREWSVLIEADTASNCADAASTGAAGGTAFALSAIFKTPLISGARWFIDRYKVKEEIIHSQLVITAEGCFDSQSMMGKLTGEVIGISNSSSTACAVIAGQVSEFESKPKNILFHSTSEIAGGINNSLDNPKLWVKNAAIQIALAFQEKVSDHSIKVKEL